MPAEDHPDPLHLEAGAVIALQPRPQIAVAAPSTIVRPAELDTPVDLHQELLVGALDEEAVVIARLDHRRHEALAKLLFAENLTDLLPHRFHSRGILILCAGASQPLLQRLDLLLLRIKQRFQTGQLVARIAPRRRIHVARVRRPGEHDHYQCPGQAPAPLHS